ncbi:MAG: hypothetical protein HRU48_13895 [Vibrio sp.]|uniref:hypothetical protein n=1 Tax=Vibrio TaxID=662 RepID=UPI001ECF0DC1|nr:hypothetical protein [Vibrio sp.]NRB68437.1 hypothetical protein [Vibrio sp.]
MNTEELITKANEGSISSKEIKYVYDALKNGSGEAYDFLLILGRANATEYRNIVEQYLHHPEDPMLSRLALQILCRYWGKAKDYIEILCEFIEGVDWDDEEDVRDMALSCASEVFKEKNSTELLKYVYDIFNNPHEDSISRGAAYESLAVLFGIEASKLPQPLHFDLETVVVN